MVGCVIAVLVAAVSCYFVGYKYGAEDLAKVKAEVQKIEADIKSSSLVLRAEHVLARIKAIL